MDIKFLKFLEAKQRSKQEDSEEEEEEEEVRQTACSFSKKANPMVNYLICDKTARQNEENFKQSIGDWLKKNGQKVIVDKYKPNKHLLKHKEESEEEEEEEEESESDESDDYELGTINHFVSKKRERDADEDSEEAELETLKEMKHLSKKNEGAPLEEYDYEGFDEEEEVEEEGEKEEVDEEREEEVEIKPQPKPKPKPKPKKEFKTNLSNTVFIRNFPKTFSEKDIEKYFSKYGDITTIRLMKTKEGESKGFGYVDYESAKGMKTAIAAKLQIKGKAINIEEAKSSFLGNSNDSKASSQKRLGKKKQKAQRNREKEAKRQLHREKQREMNQ